MADGLGRNASATMVGLVLSALWTLAPVRSNATVESVSVTAPVCDSGPSCTDTAYFNTSSVGATSQFIGSPIIAGSSTPATFASAFDAWNAANANQWTLVNGGVLSLNLAADLGPNVGPFTAGLSPVIFTLPGENAGNYVLDTAPSGAHSIVAVSQLVWTQALFINYTPLLGSLAAPIQTLDTFSLSQNGSNPNFPATCAPASSGASPAGGAFCGPIYPFQYGSTLSGYEIDGVPLGVDPFYDAPQGDWPNASFEAVTLLSTVSAATDTLTVYEGFSYGFKLSGGASTAEGLRTADAIPEPATWAMMLLGFVSLAAAALRRPNVILAGKRARPA